MLLAYVTGIAFDFVTFAFSEKLLQLFTEEIMVVLGCFLSFACDVVDLSSFSTGICLL